MNIQQMDQKYVGRDVPALPIEVVRAKGSYVYDAKGREYIDFLMGWCVGNIGWGVREVRDRIKLFSGPEYVNPYYLYKPWARLAKTLVAIAPGKLTKAFRATGGTEAVEIALQAAMKHTGRTKFISIDAYHGHSIGAMSVGFNSFRDTFSNLLPGCYKVNPPFDADKAKEVEKLLRKKDIAAYIYQNQLYVILAWLFPTKTILIVFRRRAKNMVRFLSLMRSQRGLAARASFLHQNTTVCNPTFSVWLKD